MPTSRRATRLNHCSNGYSAVAKPPTPTSISPSAAATPAELSVRIPGVDALLVSLSGTLPLINSLIDETWAKTNMMRTHGWCARGERLLAKAPYGHWRTMTFLAALRCDRVDAPCVIDGPINGSSFLAYVEQILAPTLQPGDVVIIDNLASHKSRAVEKAIRATGARLLFLPPYSPDLNPIEQVFAKLKTLLRKANTRSVETTWRQIGTLINRFTPAECANYLTNAGYASV